MPLPPRTWIVVVVFAPAGVYMVISICFKEGKKGWRRDRVDKKGK
jgi:hypothetical protein